MLLFIIILFYPEQESCVRFAGCRWEGFL